MLGYDLGLVESPVSGPTWSLRGTNVNLTVPGIILTVTGIVALIVSLTKGPNLGLSRRTGVTIGAALLVLGAALLLYTAASG